MLVWIAPIFVFGLVVFVHEMGHFLAAKWAGVYTPRFSIGFGPALWRYRRGETEYVIAAIPLGGYVRMASRLDGETAFLEGGAETPAMVGGNSAPAVAEDPAPTPRDWDPDALQPFGPHPVPEDRWFESKPLAKRLVILLAGVTMNALLALVVCIGAIAYYGRPFALPVIGAVLPGKPAQLAGLAAGDSIVSVDDAAVRTWSDVVRHIAAAPGRPIALGVARASERVTLTVTPEPTDGLDPTTRQRRTIGVIGARSAERVGREPVSFGTAIQEGTAETVAMGFYVVDVVRGLFARRVSTSELGGPIAIAQMSVMAARLGGDALLRLLALLSVNVAVLNLLPIPILDGGQIVINLVESAKGSALSARTREYVLRAGLACILLLFILVTFNDLKRIVTGLLG